MQRVRPARMLIHPASRAETTPPDSPPMTAIRPRLVVATLIAVLASAFAPAALAQTRPAGAPAPVRVEPAPAYGFHQPYLLVLPAELEPGAPVVVVFPTPTTSRDPADFLAAAERMATNAAPLLLSLKAPILVPVLPRPPVKAGTGYINLYIPALTRAAMLAEEPALARMDRQILAMADHARSRLARERQVATAEKVVFVGFSAGGQAATRMAVLHPERTLAAWAGGMGGMPILPVAEYEGQALTYPVGVADLDVVAGRPFDAQAFARVPVFIVQGSADTNTSIPADDAPSDSYSAEHGRLLRRTFGTTWQERLEKVRPVYEAANANVTFRIYEGVPHRITPEMAADMVQFLREQIDTAKG